VGANEVLDTVGDAGQVLGGEAGDLVGGLDGDDAEAGGHGLANGVEAVDGPRQPEGILVGRTERKLGCRAAREQLCRLDRSQTHQNDGKGQGSGKGRGTGSGRTTCAHSAHCLLLCATVRLVVIVLLSLSSWHPVHPWPSSTPSHDRRHVRPLLSRRMWWRMC